MALALNLFQSTFLAIAGPALAVALLMVCIATWRSRFWVQCIAVLLGTLILWAGLWLGTHVGYGAWQSMPDPPEEAFADGAQLTGTLIFGWLPAGVVTFAWWGLLTLIGFVLRRWRGPKTAPEPTS